jgi:hypothetical protein
MYRTLRGDGEAFHPLGFKKKPNNNNHQQGELLASLNNENDETLDDPLINATIVFNNRKREVQALIDSGALQGNYISKDIKDWLNSLGAKCTKCVSPVVCSAFKNGTCHECLGNLNLNIELINTNSNKPYTFDTNANVINSSFDLIIGRPDIYKHHIF